VEDLARRESCQVDSWVPGSSLDGRRITRRLRSVTPMSNSAGAVGGGAIYGLGIFGALVYYWQQADVFWEYLLSFVQGFFWPAWMVYEIFATLGG